MFQKEMASLLALCLQEDSCLKESPLATLGDSWGVPKYPGVSAVGHKAGMQGHTAPLVGAAAQPSPSFSLATKSMEMPAVIHKDRKIKQNKPSFQTVK